MRRTSSRLISVWPLFVGLFSLFALASTSAPVVAQVDTRNTETRPYVEGRPVDPRYGDRRDARPGYRPGDQTPVRPGLPLGLVPGFDQRDLPGTMPNCPPGSFNCRSRRTDR